jgi:hypothetical protein
VSDQDAAKAASKSTLKGLHHAVAQHLLNILTSSDAYCEACKRSKVDPRLVATAVKFVKENDIEAAEDSETAAVGFQYRLPEDELRPLAEEEN